MCLGADTFAVEYLLGIPTSDEGRYWWFGKICFWVVGGRVLGNRDEVTTMTTMRGSLEDVLRYRGQRHDKGLLQLPAGAAFQAIYDPLSVDRGQPLKEVREAERQFSRFNVIPNGVDVFDQWSAYLIEDQRHGRYLWRGPDEEIHEMWLRAGVVDEVLDAFLDDLCRSTGWERLSPHRS